MNIYFEDDDQHKELNFNGKASDLLKELKINPSTVLVAKNDVLIELTEELKNSDRIKIIGVVLGG